MSWEWMGDPYAAQLRAAKAEGELARIKDELREFAEENGFNPEMEPRDLLAKAAGAFRSCAAMSDARYEEIKGLEAEMEAMRPRLMPEGMEWPRFDDDAPIKFGDEFADGLGNTRKCQSVELLGGDDGVCDAAIRWGEHDCDFMLVCVWQGERVKRPAPKVLDADGVEISVGDTVYLLPGDWCGKFPCLGYHGGEELEVFSLHASHVEGGVGCRDTRRPKGTCYPQPSQLTHRAPVLAADGEPLEVGQTVWSVNDGREYKIVTVESPVQFDTTSIKVDDGKAACGVWIRPDNLTHQRPVLDADGVPIKMGDTVWGVESGTEFDVLDVYGVAVDDDFPDHTVRCRRAGAEDYESTMCVPSRLTHQRPVLDANGVPIKKGDTVYFTDGREQECNTVVHAKYDYKDEPYVQLGRLNEAGYPTYTNCSCIDPLQLTHTKPEEHDTWEKIEQDAYDYGGPNVSEFVLRCRALAERERGE